MSFVPKNNIKGFFVDDTLYDNSDDGFLFIGQKKDADVHLISQDLFPDQICMRAKIEHVLCEKSQCTISFPDLGSRKHSFYDDMQRQKKMFFLKSVKISLDCEITSFFSGKEKAIAKNTDYMIDKGTPLEKHFDFMEGDFSVHAGDQKPVGGEELLDLKDDEKLLNACQQKANFVTNIPEQKWDVDFISHGCSAQKDIQEGGLKMGLFFKKDVMPYYSCNVQKVKNDWAVIFKKGMHSVQKNEESKDD